MSRNACARSSSFRTIARTALPCFNSSSGARLINRLNLMRLFQQHGVKAPGQAYRRAVRVESGEDTMPDFPPSETPEWTSGRDGEREILRTAMKGLAEDLGIDA